jgi:hypothetical protein
MPIRNITFIGGMDVSDDVISINTQHVSSEAEAVEPSTCQVVLNNHNLVYGHAIVSGEFTPGITRIQSIIKINRNEAIGPLLSRYEDSYLLFVGVVNDAAYTNETATIDCICESGFGAGSMLDYTWSADTFVSQKANDWAETLDETVPGANIYIVDRISDKDKIKKSQFTPSKLSFNEALRAITSGASKDYYFMTDEQLIPGVVLADEETYYEIVELDPFVLEPGDATSLVGYANEVTVIPENITNIYVQANVPDAEKEKIYGWDNDEYGIAKYGRIVAPIVYDPGIYTKEDADARAEALVNWYETFIDRGIKATVCSKIPRVRSRVIFNVPDVKDGVGTIRVMAGVNKKRVEYSANGVITELECRLLERGADPEGPSEDEPEFVEVNAEVPKQWQEYLIDSAIYGPLGLLSTTKYVTFMVYKNGDVFFTDASNPKNIYPLDQAPEAVKNMFYEIENDLLDKAAYQWGSEFRQQ